MSPSITITPTSTAEAMISSRKDAAAPYATARTQAGTRSTAIVSRPVPDAIPSVPARPATSIEPRMARPSPGPLSSWPTTTQVTTATTM